ncbi:Choline-glycine betaine transporter [Saccharopolyspora kobensis]|uniref:Choline-glycine betaine transporter n=1 Tax=Saccharopolyspora kobensis TaxID=146035 RepID=A0A1H6BLJ6_9PSEU|nr:BCCT family transporter [Saccharopolyspora kobensis]SEG61315.1 Choline-glycine betaine transporter [Saccharopolyspora kobensis]SFE86923.1 Choline-glycine betaine transporter [Saccharopolyspora kobensis]
MTSTSAEISETDKRRPRADLVVSALSGGLLTAFVVTALVAPEATGNVVSTAFTACAAWFGPYWQVLLLATFVIAVVLGASRYGRVRLGGDVEPEFGTFKWLAMIMCTLLAAGGVFWASAEPVYHYVDLPPAYADVAPGSAEAVAVALAQSFSHWGFLAWAVLGTLGAIVMMRAAEQGLPLRPRTLLHPVFGERIQRHWLGTVVDVICIIAVVAGTVGPIGFLGMQVSYGMSTMFGTPDTYPMQVAIILGLTAVAVVSVITGVDKGIQLLSRFNVWLAVATMAAILVLGSAAFVVDGFLSGFARYVQDFVPMSLYRGNDEWLGSWTVFFFGWFIGYAPLMAIFVARISRGRTARNLIGFTAGVAPVATALWFTVLGGTGVMLEQRTPGSVSGPLDESGLPAALVSVAQQLPWGGLLGVVLLVLTTTFVATTTDSMSLAIATAGTSSGEPNKFSRAFWGLLMGVAAIALIAVGDSGVSALQSFIVVTAVPAGFVLLPTLWAAPKVLREMAAEQGITR